MVKPISTTWAWNISNYCQFRLTLPIAGRARCSVGRHSSRRTSLYLCWSGFCKWEGRPPSRNKTHGWEIGWQRRRERKDCGFGERVTACFFRRHLTVYRCRQHGEVSWQQKELRDGATSMSIWRMSVGLSTRCFALRQVLPCWLSMERRLVNNS